MKNKRRYEYHPQEPETEQEEESQGLTEREEVLPGTTFSLHNDNKKTMVEIEGKLYNLTYSELTLRDIKKMKFKDTPHIRHLNPIPVRSRETQEIHNSEAKSMHKLAKHCSTKRDHVGSIRQAMAVGANVPELITKLLKDKEEALKKGDGDLAKKIRKQLRGLDYKRYLSEK
uniref:Uncharacterized protein n=1 Tax=viral metagenome TaxID=1070528 RepID=A0A6M3LCW1_9ZZZZ